MMQLPSHFPAFANRYALNWARLAVFSLALSGLAPLLLIAGRASIYADMALVKAWFVPVLVIHVNLSVGLWFLACFGLIRSVSQPDARAGLFHWSAICCFCAGIFFFAIAPLAGGDAFTSNYIPVQNNLTFFLALGLITASLVIEVLQSLIAPTAAKHWLMTASQLMTVTLMMALVCFVFSVMQFPHPPGDEAFFEAVFWGGGHLLQNLYVMLAMIAWLWVSEQMLPEFTVKCWHRIPFYMLACAALLSPFIYGFTQVGEYEHIKFFTWQMNLLTGPLAIIIMLPVAIALGVSWRKFAGNNIRSHPAIIAMMMSLLLFASGGLTGYIIEGSNVIIPAHYHGSTVGVTLALMGLFYLLLPQLCGRDYAQSKWAKWQPVLCGGGQLMHVVGLAWAGGHGVARKTAGSLGAEQMGAELALQIMRIGGLVAVVGGGIFVWLMLRALFRPSLEVAQ